MGSVTNLKYDPAIKILTKKEILTPTRALDNDHDTISRTNLFERFSIVSPPLPTQYQSSAEKQHATKDHPNGEVPEAKISKLNCYLAG